MTKKKRLGELLRDRGQITDLDLTSALQNQVGKFVNLGEMLLDRKLVSKQDLAAAIGQVSGNEYLDCQKLRPSSEVLNMIPAALAKRCMAIPVGSDGKTLTVVMAKPQNFQLVAELQFKTGKKISTRFAFEAELQAALERLYVGPANSREPMPVGTNTTGIEFISSSAQQRNIEAMKDMQQELLQKGKTTPAVQLVAGTIKAAADKGASDIHIEPQQGETVVRFRIDGILRDYHLIPRVLHSFRHGADSEGGSCRLQRRKV